MMSRKAGTSVEAERDQLRDRMRGLGCSIPQIASEMGRRFNLRPRLAWRHALGWPQWKLAQEYNSAHPPALDGDEQQRLAAVLGTPSRVDAQLIEHIEAVLWRCRQQDYSLGPQPVLDTVLAQRNLARALVAECEAGLRPRLLSVVSEASRQAGWLSFDLKQFVDAGYYYEDARALAHEARNVGLGAFVLCEMSHLATEQGRPRIGIDHAVAAGQWAQRSDDMRLRAYTADVAARAYAADGQRVHV